jgi:hypothetical protein
MTNGMFENKVNNFIELFCENQSQGFRDGCVETLKWLNENVGDPFKSH